MNIQEFYQAFDQQLPLGQLQVPEHFNWVGDVFEPLRVHRHPERVLLRWPGGSQTYAQVAADMDRLLGYLRAQGLSQSNFTFMMSGVNPPLWATHLALIKGGMRLIPASTMLTVDDIVYRFSTSPPGAVFADDDNRPKVEEALQRLGLDGVVKILLDGPQPGQEGWVHFADLPPAEPQKAAPTRADEDLFYFYTSGTTGPPKTIVHSHSSLPLGHLTTSRWIGLRPEDLHYNISQPGWAKFAYSSLFGPLNVGCSILCFPGRFQAAEQLQALQDFEVTTLCAPPTALRMLVQEKLSDYKLVLRECVSAGEPLNPEVIEAWHAGTGCWVRDGYGQTETTIMVCNPPGQRPLVGSMGKLTFFYDVVIADEDGRILEAGEHGQIAVRCHPDRFCGLYPGAPKQHGNLYYTGDKAYRDSDDNFWFIGRDDDVIKTSDYRVGPFEIESALIELEEVVEAAMIGRAHAIKGMEVKTFIILRNGLQGDQQLAERIFQHCRERLTPYQRPRVLEFVEELPKTISGKIRRVELRQREAADQRGLEYRPS